MERKFYDIHYHLFDLSHPNLLAFLYRDELFDENTIRRLFKKLPFLTKILPVWLIFLFPGKIVKVLKKLLKHDAGNFRNLLSVMESSVEYHFLYIEYFLLNEKQFFGKAFEGKFDKFVICPLLIDFGYKNLKNSDCFYNLPPSKPVTNQVIDLFNSIWFYYNFDIIPHPEKSGRLKIIPTAITKDKKLFEIYPFLGLNTQNYDLPEMVELFDKYFRGYETDTPISRQKKLYNKLGTVRINIEDMFSRNSIKTDIDYFTYLFAGIKLYPPLGFDPWPADNKSELDKVKFLYSECIRLKLPLTVHCSDGGFKTSPDAAIFTDPSEKWKEVISNPQYRELRINFSHLGNQSGGDNKWLATILSYIEEYGNIYSDCSSLTPDAEDYIMVNRIMTKRTEERLLFGSDFLINLLWSRSYNEYILNFIKTPHLNERQKELISEINPQKFLFG
jgi:hypothetical protein